MFSEKLIMKSYFGKRTIDIILSSIALIFLSPIFLLIIICIFLFDRGPIFFIQKRIGRRNKIFNLIKFRSLPIGTMNITSDKLHETKITKFGAFLRRTNADELPQLINILRGEMSIVGPRPCLLSQKDLIKLRIENNSINCQPGLTGLAQINSYDYMTVKDKAFYDYEYANKISFFLDISIILKTFIYLFSPPPKY